MMQLLDAREVAKMLRISVPRVYALAREGDVRSVRVGRAIRFDPEALREFVQSGGKPLPGGWRREQADAGSH